MKKKPTKNVTTPLLKLPAQKLQEYLENEKLVLQIHLSTKSKMKLKIINFVFWLLKTRADIVVNQIKTDIVE